jgi:glutaredoxin
MDTKIFNITAIVFILSIFILGNKVQAQTPIDIYFFYGQGCPHCAKEEKFLDKLEQENKNIKINRYEVWSHPENANLLKKIGESLNLNITGVPVLIVGDKSEIGYYSDETTGQKILSIMDYYKTNSCTDRVGAILSSQGQNNPETCEHGCEKNDQECLHDCGCSADRSDNTSTLDKINIPLFGQVNIKSVSLPALTMIIGILDGFNPCALWVLIFLITLLFGMEDRTKMWILGGAFIFASAFVYFLFLAAWLNLFLYIGFVYWIRIIIGLVAIGSGAYQVREFIVNRDGTCKVTDNEKRKALFYKIRKVVLEKSFWLSLVGIMLLAAAVNAVELVCSAGLPAIYTQVLALAKLPTWQYYGYLLMYIFFYMLEALAIFIIAMVTFKIRAVSNRYIIYSNLIGGLIILILGVLLILKPGWIMFG